MKENKRANSLDLLARCLARIGAFFKKRRSSAVVQVSESSESASPAPPEPEFRLPIAEKYATALDLAPRSSLPIYQAFLDCPEEVIHEAPEEENEIYISDSASDSLVPSSPDPSRSSMMSKLSTLWSPRFSLTPTSPTLSAKTLSISYPLTRPSNPDEQSLVNSIEKPLFYTFPVKDNESDSDSGIAIPRRRKKSQSIILDQFRDSWFSILSEGSADIRRHSRSLSLTLSLAARARVDSIPLSTRALIDFIPLRERRHTRLSSFSSVSSVYSHISIIDATKSRSARLMLVKSIENMFDKNGREFPGGGLGVDEIPPVPALPCYL